MTVKTDYSHFHIHDELTAPSGSDRLLKVIAETGGTVSKFVGMIAESPRALRAFARLRSELKGSDIPEETQIRIALAVSEHRGDKYNLALAARAARSSDLEIDEISRARSFDSGDEKQRALLVMLKATLGSEGHIKTHLVEEAREAGWSDAEIIESISLLALNEFQSLLANAGALPVDQSEPSALPAA